MSVIVIDSLKLIDIEKNDTEMTSALLRVEVFQHMPQLSFQLTTVGDSCQWVASRCKLEFHILLTLSTNAAFIANQLYNALNRTPRVPNGHRINIDLHMTRLAHSTQFAGELWTTIFQDLTDHRFIT